MKTIEKSRALLRLEYGEPMISKAELNDDAVELEVVVPGVTKDSIIISGDIEKLTVEHEVDSRFTPKFRFSLYAKEVDFRLLVAKKEDGILYITAPVIKTEQLAKLQISL